MRPKYSIVLPTLHGGRTLAVTLPAMLRIDRDDIEWVVSENHSEDGSYQIIRDIVADDERVKLVRPRERLPLGKHLEFAYQQASGRWLSHIGDDDHLLPWRFELLDQALERAGESCSLVRGEYVRYSWPEYPEADKANSLDAAHFDRTFALHPGKVFAAQLLNQVHIHGGGAWVVRSDVVQTVRRRSGFFASPQHVEFFAMRAAAALGDQVATVGLPLFILGRHSKSSGTQYFNPKASNREQTWDWAFEDPESYRYCPLNWKSYSTLSLDGALTAQAMLKDELGSVPVAWHDWTRTIHSEMIRLVQYGQLPREARRDFLHAVRQVPGEGSLYWRWRTWRLVWQALWKRERTVTETPSTPLVVRDGIVQLSQRVLGNQNGFHSIIEVPRWLEKVSQGELLRLRS